MNDENSYEPTTNEHDVKLAEINSAPLKLLVGIIHSLVWAAAVLGVVYLFVTNGVLH